MRLVARLVLACSLIGPGCAADEEFHPIELPAPSGPHAIGRSSFHWSDAGRPEVMSDAPEDVRELTVHVWYPAEPGDGEPAEYMPDLDVLGAVLDDIEVRQWQAIVTHASADAPVSAAQERYPVIVLSPGNDMNSPQFSVLAEALASHGFIVAAIDHPYDARAVALADGRVVAYAEERWPPPPPPPDDGMPVESDHSRFYRARVEARTADASFVLDRLATIDDERLAGRLDLEHVGFVGHSVGGVAAGRVCQSDARFAACVNLDGDSGFGPFYLDADGQGFAQPYMMLTKPFAVPDDLLAKWGLTREQWLANFAAEKQRFFGSVAAGSLRLVIAGAAHQDFADDPLMIALQRRRVEEAAGRRRIADIVVDYTLAFFAWHLEGEPSPLLDAASPEHPEVTFEAWPPVQAG